MSEVKAARDAQAEEYGQFVATVAIDFEGARAFNPGQPVPTSSVERYGYEALGVVERVQTQVQANKAARTAKDAS